MSVREVDSPPGRGPASSGSMNQGIQVAQKQLGYFGQLLQCNVAILNEYINLSDHNVLTRALVTLAYAVTGIGFIHLLTDSYTPLQRACFYKSKEIVQKLLKAGADPYAKDTYGNTLFHFFAFSEVDLELFDLVFENVEFGKIPLNSNSQTPFEVAVRRRETALPITSKILEKMTTKDLAEVSKLRFMGTSPLDYLCKYYKNHVLNGDNISIVKNIKIGTSLC